MPSDRHERTVTDLIASYRRQGYQLILDDVAPIIPDALLISPEGKLLWLEVETKVTSDDKIRFKRIKRIMRRVGGTFKLIVVK